jgi:PelA/Pel-15E family pectate lyase
MPHPVRRIVSFALIGLATLSVRAADATPPPRPWDADAFQPVTAERNAALPAAEQPAWQAYWRETTARSNQLPPRDLVDHTPNHPVPIGTMKASYSKGVKLDAPAAWYATPEARTIADRIVQWQRPTGGWTKSGDYTRAPTPEDDHHDGWSNGTFDNDATITELRFLARTQRAAGDDPRAAAWRDAFGRGLNYILAAQYPNGGFPQIYPLIGWYHDAITYNDDAMVHILGLLRDIANRREEFAFLPAATAREAAARVERGTECVLASQLRDAQGRPTAWSQQIDALTLKPCAARNFEPISECANESVGLTLFLMSIAQPSPRVVAAVEGAMAWFQQRALHGVVWDRRAGENAGLVAKPDAPDLWARFYEIGTGRPVFGDRDRTIHYAVGEVSPERRQGYGWFSTRPNELPAAYAAWKARLKR